MTWQVILKRCSKLKEAYISVSAFWDKFLQFDPPSSSAALKQKLVFLQFLLTFLSNYVNFPPIITNVSLFCLSEKPRYVPGPGVNIAKDFKLVTQSSEYLPAERAIDGDSNTSSHTNTEPNAWWSMEFCSDVIIARVRLWNRSDCCDDQMANFVVTVDNKICGRVDGAIGVGKSIDVTCPKPLVGKMLKIQRTDNFLLSISELQLFSSIKTCWESREATNSFCLDRWQRNFWTYSRRTYRKPVSKRLNRNE